MPEKSFISKKEFKDAPHARFVSSKPFDYAQLPLQTGE
jgi:hypothetical protein